jgi:hypothetical protein
MGQGKEVEGLFSIGESFLPEFLRRTEKWRGYIVVHFRFEADLPQSSLFRLEKEIEPAALTGDVSPTAVSPDEIEAAFDYSLNLVAEDKKANVIAAKAMAYVARNELQCAHEIIMQSRYGPVSRANQFNSVEALIERKLAALRPAHVPVPNRSQNCGNSCR